MTKINPNRAQNPSFQGMLHFTKKASDNLNKKMQRLLFPKRRAKVLDEYDKFIRTVSNSKFDVYVSEIPEGQLIANVSNHGSKKTIAYAINRNRLLSKLGFENPIKFMKEAFQKALNRSK